MRPNHFVKAKHSNLAKDMNLIQEPLEMFEELALNREHLAGQHFTFFKFAAKPPLRARLMWSRSSLSSRDLQRARLQKVPDFH
ncbi:hypothetical protein [Pseudomonas aeruginosa]|uniref:hypothetical protein n=1 Tax=Pseudomonas aeruginosa TaxID=287 RepID=UPI0021621D6B|nr:hypothetical protein [Pseudomonas aeruginosa]